MDLMKMGQELLADKLGDKAGGLMEGLAGLTGGNLDIGSLMGKLKEGGLGDQVDSWMGDGDNAPVSADQLKSALGEDQIAAASEKMGVDTDTAAQQLSESLPDLADKFSGGGSMLDPSALMEKLGGASGALDMAKGLFNK
jgi:uncharacterized protein YidB (DUF937 family)